MPKISAVGLFCLDKFENNQTRTRTTFFRTSKLTELYFKEKDFLSNWIALAVLTLQGLGSEKQDKILGYFVPPIWLQFCVKFIAG